MLAKGPRGPPKLVTADMLLKIKEPTAEERVGLFHLARGDPCIADVEEPKLLLTEIRAEIGGWDLYTPEGEGRNPSFDPCADPSSGTCTHTAPPSLLHTGTLGR